MLKSTIGLVLALTLVVCSAAGQGAAVSGDPDSAQLVTSDIDNFWRAYDHSTAETRATALDREYLAVGSKGLRDFVALRIQSADSLAKTVNACPRFYESIRTRTMSVSAMRPRIKATFYALKYLYDEAVFPNVYFVIGRMSSGGTTSRHGLLIGAEMYGRTPGMPESELTEWHKQVIKSVEDIPFIVAHELIHYQQKYPPDIRATVLEKSISEGAADFLGELISGGNINRHLFEYADPKEKQLWLEFTQDMGSRDYSRWLFNGSTIKDRPADLGYYVGYRITEAYYNRAANKKQAIKEILTIKDFRAFLAASGYEAKFPRQTQQALGRS
jgi:hypothetical protein